MEVLVVMTEEQFKQIPSEVRGLFKHINFKEENEYETHKKDSVYKELYKRKSKASKELDDYLFKKRHN